MAQVTFDFKFVAAPDMVTDDLQKTKDFFQGWVAKKLFQESVNGGMQNTINMHIQLVNAGEDSADFEVVDGWASPCLRYSILK